MHPSASGKRFLIAGILCALAGMAVAPDSASALSCKPVVNPYAGVEGVNLRHIRATGVGCTTARQVVRRATYKSLIGLFTGPDASGLYHLSWNGWAVTFDVTIPRAVPDRYVAKRRDKRVRWIL